MKTHYLHRISLAGLLAACVVTGAYAQAVQTAGPEWEARTLSRMGGQTIRASNDEHISNVVDYLIEPKSGELRYAVVASGAGAGGETYRLVPVNALDQASNGQSLKVRIDRGRWDRVGTLAHNQLGARYTMNEDHRRRLAQQFGVSNLPGDGSVELVRASALKGRPIHTPQESLGTLSDVAIDFQNRVAWAVVTAASQLPGAGQNYLFPFDKLELGDLRGAATTTLSRHDFAVTQPNLAPTGFMNNYGQNISGAVSAVQHAVQNVAPRGSVQVTPESRIVLRGTVDNPQQAAQVQQAASQAAQGVRVDNELNVRSRW